MITELRSNIGHNSVIIYPERLVLAAAAGAAASLADEAAAGRAHLVPQFNAQRASADVPMIDSSSSVELCTFGGASWAVSSHHRIDLGAAAARFTGADCGPALQIVLLVGRLLRPGLQLPGALIGV